MNSKLVPVENVIKQESKNSNTVTVYRFDIFKGVPDSEGKIQKIKSVGSAYLREGLRTYTVHLKTFLQDAFYLLQNTRNEGPDFVLLSREPSKREGKKYHWNNCGEANVMPGVNMEIMKLEFDLFGEDIYMTLTPARVQELENYPKAVA